MHKYEIVIYWSEEDKVYIAQVPDLKGCLAHGKTPLEAVENVNEAVELWLETAKEFGEKIPEPQRHLLAA